MKKLLLALVGLGVVAVVWILWRAADPTSRTSPPERPPPPEAPRQESAREPADFASQDAGVSQPGETDVPPAPQVSAPGLRLVDHASGEPLPEAWVVLRRSEEDEDTTDAAPTSSEDESDGETRFAADAEGIVRIAEVTLGADTWSEACVDTPAHPAHAFDASTFRAFFTLPPPGTSRDPDQPVPVLPLHSGVAVSGVVEDDEGHALEGVRVVASGDVEWPPPSSSFPMRGFSDWSDETLTNAEGGYRLRAIFDPEELEEWEAAKARGDPEAEPPGVWMEYSKAGYLTSWTEVPLDAAPVLGLVPAFEVTVRVADTDRDPIPQVFVAVEVDGDVEASREDDLVLFWVSFDTEEMSDEDGSFALLVSDRLQYAVKAIHPAYHRHEVLDYRPERGQDLVLTLRPRSRVTVRLVAGETPAPVTETEVMVIFPIAGWRPETTTDGGGLLSVPFPPGEAGREMLFVAPAAGFARHVVPPLTDTDQDLGEVRLDPGHSLSVRLVDAAGEPREGIELGLELVTSSETQLQVGTEDVLAVWREGESDAGGEATFGHLPAGEYTLRLGDGWYPHPPPERVISLRVPEDSPRTVDVVGAAEIHGTVVTETGEAIPDAVVVLLPPDGEDYDEDPPEVTRSDWRGAFRLVLPGHVAAPQDGQVDRAAALADAIDWLTLHVGHDLFESVQIPLSALPAAGESLEVGVVELARSEDDVPALIIEFADFESDEEDPEIVVQDPEGRKISDGYESYPDPDTGEARVEDLAPGTYTVAILREGFLPWQSEPVTVVRGTTRVLRPDFERGVTLSGLVLDAETGRPIRGAWVDAVQAPGVSRWPLRTDDDGRFVVSGLSEGPVILDVSAHGHDDVRVVADAAVGLEEPIRLPSREVESPLFVLLDLLVERPDGLLLAAEETVAVEYESSYRSDWDTCVHEDEVREAGLDVKLPFRFRVWAAEYLPSVWHDVEHDVEMGEKCTAGPFRVRLQRGPPLTVLVTDSAGAPVSGARVTIGGDGVSTLVPGKIHGATGADGEVVLRPFPPGTYGVEVRAYEPVRSRVLERREYRGGDEPVRVRLVRGAMLEAEVRFPRGPVPLDIEVGDVAREPDGLRTTLHVDSIPPGEQEVIVRDETDFVLFRRRILFREGTTERLEVDLTELGALRGRLKGIRGGGPRAFAWGASLEVLLLENRNALASVPVRRDGGFDFPLVPPGRYRLRWSGLIGLAPPQEVEVHAGEITHVELEYRAHTLRGRVRGAAGAPVRGARVVVSSGRDEEDTFHVWPDGSFSLPGVVEGRHSVRFEAPGHVPRRVEVTLHGDQVLDVTLDEASP